MSTSNNIVKEYESIIASWDLIKLSKGKGIINVDIPEIPQKKTRFLNTNSFWKNANIDNEKFYGDEESVNGCYYWASHLDEFDSHVHEESDELIIPLNKGASFDYILGTGERGNIKYGETLFIPKGVWHYIGWIKDTKSLILWSPSLEGWQGNFKDIINK